MYSYGPPHMAVQKQDDQHEHTFSSYVRIWDVVLKTYLGRWTIGRSGERGSGISVLPARHDDDDDISIILSFHNCIHKGVLIHGVFYFLVIWYCFYVNGIYCSKLKSIVCIFFSFNIRLCRRFYVCIYKFVLCVCVCVCVYVCIHARTYRSCFFSLSSSLSWIWVRTY